MLYILKNDSLTIQFDDLGAELTSIVENQSDTQYLWNADPVYWKRHSPILFPFVGALKNKSYTYQGKTYPMVQHGFARDMHFNLVKQSDDEIWFCLESTPQTLEVYPFKFRLELGYRLKGREITVLWKVINIGAEKMYFSIGGHPAFRCPLNRYDHQIDCYISFDTKEAIRYMHVNEKGLLKRRPKHQLTTDSGKLPIDLHMFDYDALIIEGNQCHEVSLLNPSRIPYLSVKFDAPLFGMWSPAGKNAPFICIEPWYGRCDANDFKGSLEEREWGNCLQAGAIFEASYKIEIK